MRTIFYKSAIVAGLALTIVSCGPSKQELIEKGKKTFVSSCTSSANSNPAAAGMDFGPYCDCAWDKLIKDKKFEEIITSGKDNTKEAEEYMNKKISDESFSKDLQECMGLIKK